MKRGGRNIAKELAISYVCKQNKNRRVLAPKEIAEAASLLDAEYAIFVLGHLALPHSINANTLSAVMRTTLETTYQESENLRHLVTLKTLPQLQRSFLG